MMRILVADDDELSLEIVRAAVERLGHECATAADGASAWTHLISVGADVVISDWLMPELSGVELCAKIRAHSSLPYPYVILLTGLDDHADVLAAMQAGVDDHLVKPLILSQLEVRLIAAARVTALHRQLDDRHQAQAQLNRQLVQSRAELKVVNAGLSELAHRDALTGLGNRLRLSADVTTIETRVERYGHRFCVALCDVDNFKQFNDTNGHQAGDRVLTEIGRIIATECRAGDLSYRYGGEEFLIIYPEQTTETARTAIDRIRSRIAECSWNAVPPTISVGFAEMSGSERFEGTLRRADAGLYEAKRTGRDRVVAVAMPAGSR